MNRAVFLDLQLIGQQNAQPSSLVSLHHRVPGRMIGDSGLVAHRLGRVECGRQVIQGESRAERVYLELSPVDAGVLSRTVLNSPTAKKYFV